MRRASQWWWRASRLDPRPRARVDVLLFFQLPQDLDLLLPVREACARAGLEVGCAATRELFERSPRAAAPLAGAARAPRAEVIAGRGVELRAHALLSASETTAGPHAAAHALTRRANWLGLRTYTVQHGYESVGLRDRLDDRFASQVVFTWGGLETLAPAVDPATRRRCVPVGCVKPARPARVVALPGPGPHLLVLENLHWDRYDEAFRQRFLRDLAACAAAWPGATLLKPHHAGRWATERHRGELPEGVAVLDPRDPEWEPHTAPALLAAADAAITTPSTVALDAARLALPVAVVTYEQDASPYDPLPALRSGADWLAFLEEARAQRWRPVARARAFVDRVLVPGDGAAAIAARVAADIAPQREATPGQRLRQELTRRALDLLG